ncbi:hypothetical protein [Sphingobium tyrosinilyticum]|uniref:FecR protein domain-containing protein n=1 Tax=Sphingobium tyrosinilyticum TaxID=2715436 RepID=A0ABV9EYX0_9SPHN
MKPAILGTIAFGLAVPANAQQMSPPATAAAPIAAQPAMLIAQPQVQQATAVLPANTQITLAMNDTITTKGNRYSEGDTFGLSVVHNVMLGNYVIIPKGSRGVGRITWLTNKGAFGKSGKMEIGLEYVEVGGRQIPLTGTYRQEGEGNTVATVGTVIAVGVFAGFVTGKSGTIPQGRELVARTKEDLPVAFAGPAPVLSAPMAVHAVAAQPSPMTVSAPTAPTSVAPASSSFQAPTGRAKIRCDTCQ